MWENPTERLSLSTHMHQAKPDPTQTLGQQARWRNDQTVNWTFRSIRIGQENDKTYAGSLSQTCKWHCSRIKPPIYDSPDDGHSRSTIIFSRGEHFPPPACLASRPRLNQKRCWCRRQLSRWLHRRANKGIWSQSMRGDRTKVRSRDIEIR